MKRHEIVSLEQLGGGAVSEMFGSELEKAIRNIADPNTDAVKKRAITLKVSMKPNKDRNLCEVEISCDSKLAPVSPFQTAMFVGVDHKSGEAKATEYYPEQMGLTVTDDDGKKVDVRTGEVVELRRSSHAG